jgi:hypothetical protein
MKTVILKPEEPKPLYVSDNWFLAQDWATHHFGAHSVQVYAQSENKIYWSVR